MTKGVRMAHKYEIVAAGVREIIFRVTCPPRRVAVRARIDSNGVRSATMT